jgi:hypothetical protein
MASHVLREANPNKMLLKLKPSPGRKDTNLMTPRNVCHIAESSASSYIVVIALTAMLVLSCSSLSWGQGLDLGSVTSFVPVDPCPEGLHSGNRPLPEAVCYTATVDNCPDHGLGTIPPINATVAVSTPLSNWNLSTIFLHNGSNGEDYFGQGYGGTSYAAYYYSQNFQVVQIAWAAGTSWRDNANQPRVKSMKYEACRPATLLKYVYDSIHGGSTLGAMCAQGHSTGATALAYALAWYNATSYLNNVVLTSGPAQANIEAGCQYPAAQQYQNPITVCPPDQCIDGPIPPGSWLDFTQYLNTPPNSAAQSVADFTNNPAGNCNDWRGTHAPTDAFNANWRGMSVVSANAVYSYPSTSVYAFLCAPPTTPYQTTQNNSAAQAWLFLQKLLPPYGQTLNHGFYRVNNCTGDEEIWDGTDWNGTTNEIAFDTSKNAMISACVP